MILSTEDIDARLRSIGNLVRTNGADLLEVKPLHPTALNKLGLKEIPIEIKTIAGIAAHFDTNKNVAETFGMSPQTVRAVKAGHTNSSYGSPNQELKDAVKAGVEEVKSRAIEVATKALGHTLERLEDPERVGSIKTVDLASIAQKVGSLAGLSDKGNSINDNRIQTIVYAPNSRAVEEYDIIEQ